MDTMENNPTGAKTFRFSIWGVKNLHRRIIKMIKEKIATTQTEAPLTFPFLHLVVKIP